MSVETLQDNHPPLTPEISLQTAADFFSDQDGIDTADALDNYFRLRSRYQSDVNDRVLPPPESLSPNPEAYLQNVARLQRFFNSRLGKACDQRVILNYNPVLERAVYEHLETAEQKKQFKQYEITQVEKALRERYNVATSMVIYDIDENGKLRSRDLPNQPFADVLTTGIEYYRQLGSSDVNRMEQERAGFLKIQQVFTTPQTAAEVNLKAEVISGPGLVAGTIFTDNFLDRYELLEEPLTRQRYVQMTRFTSDVTYEQYEERIAALQPDYFEGISGPKDEWFLSRPLFEGQGEILIQRKTSLKEEDFQKIVQESTSHIRYLVETICDVVFRPEQVAIALNAVLNGADYVKDKIFSSVSQATKKIIPMFKTFIEEVDWLGHQAVRLVAAGCGASGGFAIEGRFSKIIKGRGKIKNNISGKDQYGSLEFACPKCHRINRRPYGRLISNCQHCLADVRC